MTLKYLFLLNIIFFKFSLANLTQENLKSIQLNLLNVKNNNLNSDILKKELLDSINYLILNIDLKEQRKQKIKDRILLAQSEISESLKNKKNITNPLVTFIMPCYNRIKTVREAIDSIYIQNLDIPFEVIVVDDASIDGTFEILKEYENKYDNFFVYKHLKNKKAPAARNTAICHSRGKYIFNLDSDNVLTRGFIKPLIKIMEENKYDVVYPSQVIFCEDNIHTIQKIQALEKGLLDFQTAISSASLVLALDCKLFTKKSWEDVGGFLEIPGHDSWGFNYTLLASGHTFYIANEGEYFHRIWSDNSNMWRIDHQKKVMDVNPLFSMREYPEILTDNTLNFIKNYSLHSNNFICNELSKIKLINKNSLENFFEAYKFEESNNFKLACDSYRKIYLEGNKHLNILLKFLKSLIICENFDEALIVFNEVKEKIIC